MLSSSVSPWENGEERQAAAVSVLSTAAPESDTVPTFSGAAQVTVEQMTS